MTIFNLPDLGEGLPDAEISQWHVKVGDFIKVDEPMVAMETAKAVVDVPSPIEGKILKLFGNTGDVIQTGSPLVEYEVVGKAKEDTGTVAGKIEVGNIVVQDELISVAGKSGNIKVTPAVRAIAKSLNVDLALITPSGANGMITADDVRKAGAAGTAVSQSSCKSSVMQSASQKTAQLTNNSKANPTANYTTFLPAGHEPLKGVRRAMSISMSHAHAEVVPVTLMDDADVTDWIEKDDITTRLIQAIVTACQKEPALNAWYDAKLMSRYPHPDVNVGLAIDAPEGLFVAVIKETQKKSAVQIRQDVDVLKQEVNQREIAPEKLKGQTITLSNFGKFAGRYASPIVVPPTVAIIGVGSLRDEVLAIKGEAKVRKVLPISITFDHRCVTGGETTRFLGELLAALK